LGTGKKGKEGLSRRWFAGVVDQKRLSRGTGCGHFGPSLKEIEGAAAGGGGKRVTPFSSRYLEPSLGKGSGQSYLSNGRGEKQGRTVDVPGLPAEPYRGGVSKTLKK